MALLPSKVKPVPDIEKIKFHELDQMNLNEKQNRLIRNFILNQNPYEKWLKPHPVYGNKYLPIDKVEWLLTVLFGKWYVEVKQVQMIANSVQCTVILFYWNSYNKAYDKQEGVGASAIQQDTGGGAVKSNGVMLAAPAAKSYAIKDAADMIGRVFGRDLNRKNPESYSGEGEKFKNLLTNDNENE